MAYKHLRIDPMQLADNSGFQIWYYEEADGIEIHWNNGQGVRGQAKIPWKFLRAGLKRKDKK